MRLKVVPTSKANNSDSKRAATMLRFFDSSEILVSKYSKATSMVRVEKVLPLLNICDIGNITFYLTMAKYLPMLSRGETVQ
jgi:hypothetical protein